MESNSTLVPRKFSSKEITALFDEINSDKQIQKLYGEQRYGYSQLKPVRIEHFDNPAQIRSLVKNEKFNAFACLYVTHVYENFPKASSYSRVDMQKIAEGKVYQFANRISDILEASSSQLYRSLKVEVMNNNIDVVRTYTDMSDDGDDWYGVDVFLKFSFK